MQFSSDLDEATKKQLRYGQGLMRLLRQKQYNPYKQHEQVILLTAAMGHIFQDVPVDKIPQFSRSLLDSAASEIPDLCEKIDRTGETSEEERESLLGFAKRFLERNGG